MELTILLATIILLLSVFNTILLFGVSSILLKIADQLNKQVEQAEKEKEDDEIKPTEADGVPADLLIYNPYAGRPVGKLERTR